MVDLSTIEVGNNVKLRNGTIRTVVAEQYIFKRIVSHFKMKRMKLSL